MAAGGKAGGVRLLCGPYGSGRAACIDGLMRAHWGRAVLLLPTRRYAQRRLENLILDSDLPGLFGRTVLTFDDFVADLLRAEGKLPRRLGDFERRLLLESALARVAQNKSLKSLGEVTETHGFVTQMLDIITQIKQAAVDPEKFRAYAASGGNWLDPVVADVYEAYQSALQGSGLYDVPGMFWEAAVICRERRPRRIEDVEALLLDGFDDFTPSEFNLLAALRPHLQLLALGLNCDTTPNRSDLYAAPLRTARRIEGDFDAAIENFEAPAPESCTEHAAASIFWRDQPAVPPEQLRRNLEIVPCADLVQEVEAVGRRVKRLLLEKTVAPGDIAVVYAASGPQAATVRAVFGEFGIPVRVLEQPALWDSSVGAFVLAVLEAFDGWQRETVVDVLTSPWFMPGRPYTGAIPALARAASIISGREEWRSRLEALAARTERETSGMPRIPDAKPALDGLLEDIETLGAIDDALPKKAATAEFIEALKSILDELDVAGAVRNHPAPEIRESEQCAFDALYRMLDAWREWSRDGQEVSRSAFASDLRQALQLNAFGPRQPRDAVLCMKAQDVRGLEFGHLFFIGLNEGEVPAPPRISAVYSQQDLANLGRAGIELEGRYAHIEREMLRFHHVLCAARDRLVITWRTVSPGGQEQHPSPYIKDLLELFPGERIEAPMPRSNDFVPPLEMAASWRDVRNAAFLANEAAAASLQSQFPRLKFAAGMEAARHDPSPFGIYDGVLREKRLVAQVAGRFGRDHVFSVNQLESYAKCPFRFFVDRVLGIKEDEEPTSEFDGLVRGSILHEVLQAFHEKYRLVPACAIPREDAEAALEELVEEAFARQGWRSVNAPPAVIEVEKRYALSLLRRYLENERGRNETQWQPAHFEVAFGRQPGKSQSRLDKLEAYRLDLGGGQVFFAGRIDRIDLHETRAAARIIDYKTKGIPGRADIREGRSLQLAVYAQALEELLMPGTSCEEARFLSISKDEHRDLKPEERDAVRGHVQRTVAGVRAAHYQPEPTNKNVCSSCPAKRVCRYEEARVERKKAAREARS